MAHRFRLNAHYDSDDLPQIVLAGSGYAKRANQPDDEIDMRKAKVTGMVYMLYGSTGRYSHLYHTHITCQAMVEPGGTTFETPMLEGERHTYVSVKGHIIRDPELCRYCSRRTDPAQPLTRSPAEGQGDCKDYDDNPHYNWFGKFYGKTASDPAHNAMMVCMDCPIKVQCRNFADEIQAESGIWGGEPAHVRIARWVDAKASRQGL